MAEGNAKGAGNFQDVLKGDITCAAFELTDVGAVYVGLQRKPFLR